MMVSVLVLVGACEAYLSLHAVPRTTPRSIIGVSMNGIPQYESATEFRDSPGKMVGQSQQGRMAQSSGICRAARRVPKRTIQSPDDEFRYGPGMVPMGIVSGNMIQITTQTKAATSAGVMSWYDSGLRLQFNSVAATQGTDDELAGRANVKGKVASVEGVKQQWISPEAEFYGTGGLPMGIISGNMISLTPALPKARQRAPEPEPKSDVAPLTLRSYRSRGRSVMRPSRQQLIRSRPMLQARLETRAARLFRRHGAAKGVQRVVAHEMTSSALARGATVRFTMAV